MVFLANNFRLQWPTLRHTGISCCCFMAEVFLLPVAIKLASFAGKCSEMEKRPKRSCFWSIADHFEANKIHFTVPLKSRAFFKENL